MTFLARHLTVNVYVNIMERFVQEKSFTKMQYLKSIARIDLFLNTAPSFEVSSERINNKNPITNKFIPFDIIPFNL